MIPRCACLLLFVIGVLASRSLCAEEELEKPDPGRFGSPLIRAWIPSTLADDRNVFRSQIRHAMNPEDNSVLEPGPEIATAREGILVYYDPHPRRLMTVDRWGQMIAVGEQPHFPGNPWLKPVRFMKIGSRDEFEREVRSRTGAVEESSQLTTLTSKHSGFIVNNPFQLLSEISFEQSDYLGAFLNRVNLYWTYRDGYMFFGDFEEILTMELPNPRDLEPQGTDADRDIFVQVDLNSVLPRQKRMLWDIIRKEFEKNLQQFDDEGDAAYAFRKSVGDLQLNLIQAVTQDLESVKLGIDFASEEKPAKAELQLTARPRVNLERYFGKSGIGTPALTAFVEEPAALTLATSWGLPDRMVQTFEKLLKVVDAKLDQQQGWTVDAILASQELAFDLRETIREANQVAVKLTPSENGFTLFGGIRIRNPERVSKNLAIVLNGLTGADGWGVQQSRDSSGRTYYSFRPADLSPFVTNHRRERFPAELHFIVVDDILWFSVGRQDSLDILAQALDRIEEQQDRPVRSSIPLALIDVSLDQLFPQQDLDKTEGFDRVPLAMVEKLDSLIPRQGGPIDSNFVVSVSFSDRVVRSSGTLRVAGNPQARSKPVQADIRLNAVAQENSNSPRIRRLTENDIKITSPTADFADTLTFTITDVAHDPMTMQKFLQPDQSRIRIQFDADEKRVTARATVGLGVIKHIYARMMEVGLTSLNHFMLMQFINDNRPENIGGDIQFSAPGGR